MAINGSASFPPSGTPTIDGATIMDTGLLTTLNAAVVWTTLTVVPPNPAYTPNSNFTVGSGANVSALVVSGSYSGETTLSSTFTGTFNNLTCDDQNNYGANFNLRVAGSVGGITLNQQQIGTMAVTTNQSSPLSVGIGFANNDGATVVINALSVTSLSLGYSDSTAFNSVTLNGAFDVTSVNAALATLVAASPSEGTYVIGGTSAAPTTQPELDTLAQTGTPADGDSFTVVDSDSSQPITVGYSSAIPFSASALVGSTLTIGISDNPDPTTQITPLVVSSMIVQGYSAVQSGTDIHLTDSTFVHWPISYTQNAGGPNYIFTNTQAGIDNVAALVALGNTVTTN